MRSSLTSHTGRKFIGIGLAFAVFWPIASIAILVVYLVEKLMDHTAERVIRISGVIPFIGTVFGCVVLWWIASSCMYGGWPDVANGGLLYLVGAVVAFFLTTTHLAEPEPEPPELEYFDSM